MTGRVAWVVAAALSALGATATRGAAQQASSTPASEDVSALPLHLVASRATSPTAIALLLSGDGGWAGIDKRIADDLSARGVAVVGLDSRSYLMKARTPDEVAADMARVIRHYTARWNVQRLALVGYSRGADMAPFIVNRLPGTIRSELALVALLSPAERASFQFHWADLLAETSKPSDAPILPELERLRGTPVLCVYGKDEKESLCRLADTSAVHVDKRAGRHHFDGDYDAVAAEILRYLIPLDTTSR
jgi:type IV secretory pathway VirJ component